jgi:hypothetical protein
VPARARLAAADGGDATRCREGAGAIGTFDDAKFSYQGGRKRLLARMK